MKLLRILKELRTHEPLQGSPIRIVRTNKPQPPRPQPPSDLEHRVRVLEARVRLLEQHEDERP